MMRRAEELSSSARSAVPRLTQDSVMLVKPRGRLFTGSFSNELMPEYSSSSLRNAQVVPRPESQLLVASSSTLTYLALTGLARVKYSMARSVWLVTVATGSPQVTPSIEVYTRPLAGRPLRRLRPTFVNGYTRSRLRMKVPGPSAWTALDQYSVLPSNAPSTRARGCPATVSVMLPLTVIAPFRYLPARS